MVLGFGTHRRYAARAGVMGGEVGLADDRGVPRGRVGAEGEQVDEPAGVATGGVGLVEDAVFTDGGRVEVGADSQPNPPMADGCVEVTCGSVVQEEVLVERFRPAVVAVVEVGGQPVSDRCGEDDGAAIDVQASVDEIGDPKALDVAGAQAVEGDQGDDGRSGDVVGFEGGPYFVDVDRQRLSRLVLTGLDRARVGSTKSVLFPLRTRNIDLSPCPVVDRGFPDPGRASRMSVLVISRRV